MNPNFQQFTQQILHPVKYKMFLLTKLPMAFFSGLKMVSLSHKAATVSVTFSWINKNPFKSIYFAVLSMAAELSTGVLAFGQIYKRTPKVSMLVVKLEAEFYKKAVGTVHFTCIDGENIVAAIEQSIQQKVATTVACTSIGKNSNNEVVAKFIFTWSFKCQQ